ncbi:HEAT repeat domain-containing protein [bacterium]|nr:HEAT repeat domain-containing protein [bacterium]
MGLMDLLRKKKLPPGDPRTQKAGVKLINKNAELGSRYDAASELAKIDNSEAIYCLLQRFTVVIGGPTPDEDEKANVRKIIVRAGSKSIEPIMRFLKNQETVGQALEILKTIASEDEVLDNLLDLTDSFDPYFSKYPDKKIQTFREIQTFRDPRIVAKMEPFLDDDDDDIRITTVKVLAAQNDEEATRKLLIQAILENHERPRVRKIACEIMNEKGWTVKGYRNQVESALPEQFYMNKKGQLLTR